MDSIVEIKNLTKQYKKGALALNKVNINIKKGEIFGLLGPNGAGKTTLINCMTSLAKINAGTIHIKNFDVEKEYMDTRQLLGLSPQDFHFDPFYTQVRDIALIQPP